MVCLVSEWSIIQWTKNSFSFWWAHALAVQAMTGPAPQSPLGGLYSLGSSMATASGILTLWGCSSLVEHLPSVGTALRSGPAQQKHTTNHADLLVFSVWTFSLYSSTSSLPGCSSQTFCAEALSFSTKSWALRHQRPLFLTHEQVLDKAFWH